MRDLAEHTPLVGRDDRRQGGEASRVRCVLFQHSNDVGRLEHPVGGDTMGVEDWQVVVGNVPFAPKLAETLGGEGQLSVAGIIQAEVELLVRRFRRRHHEPHRLE